MKILSFTNLKDFEEKLLVDIDNQIRQVYQIF
jgi:hypothetical protein